MNRSALSALSAVNLLFRRGYAPGMNAALRSWVSTLGWAAYLACSWTWCIGMFLPVLLVRDFGVWGFVVFAVPNVLGAAAMGWVLRNGVAERLQREHRPAIRAFSLVTVLFHAFFLGWFVNIFSQDAQSRAAWQWVAIVMIAALLGPSLWTMGRERLAAGVTWVASLGAGLIMLRGGALDHTRSLLTATADAPGLLLLSPAVAFGFLLCPYLDATFLHARRLQPARQARLSFTLGFGVFFAAMILLTLAYAGVVELRPDAAIGFALAGALTYHVLSQISLTICLHIGEAPLAVGARRGTALTLAALAAAAAGYVTTGGRWAPEWADGFSFEVGYRLFMSFYGLLFPAYVWLCMIPTRAPGGVDRAEAGEGGVGRRKLLVLFAVVLIAAPMYWLGFIERNEVWLLPGLAVVLLSRAALPGGLLPPMRAKREG